ncbi:dihydrodiol dehydrogenase [Mycobacterium hodleri]|uniref:Dihydrodiol dehydrogenase n=1 Tax=Mycolicibacterium hodleri TaxID=49897 RepID=A0A502E4Y8_9MYCO|nr:dihydrodiol dehydrogenase [Mycolicibacterium hodleri]
MNGQKDLRPDEGFSIVNEFGGVFVRKVHTRNGERLQITAARLGYETRLDALQLEAISWQKPEFFSQLMETPFGPEAEQS